MSSHFIHSNTIQGSRSSCASPFPFVRFPTPPLSLPACLPIMDFTGRVTGRIRSPHFQTCLAAKRGRHVKDELSLQIRPSGTRVGEILQTQQVKSLHANRVVSLSVWAQQLCMTAIQTPGTKQHLQYFAQILTYCTYCIYCIYDCQSMVCTHLHHVLNYFSFILMIIDISVYHWRHQHYVHGHTWTYVVKKKEKSGKFEFFKNSHRS